jgi:hypothetical protein
LKLIDLCEVARNSVLQSGYEREIKKHWLGENYHLPGPDGNDIQKTNVPNMRLQYRHETLIEEWDMIMQCGGVEAREGIPGYPVLQNLKTARTSLGGLQMRSASAAEIGPSNVFSRKATPNPSSLSSVVTTIDMNLLPGVSVVAERVQSRKPKESPLSASLKSEQSPGPLSHEH